jgi:hypothetical protein
MAFEGLYVIEANVEEGFKLSVSRYPLDEVNVGITEALEQLEPVRGSEARYRGWGIGAGDRGPFAITTEELDPARLSPPREERFARSLARKTGWPIPD